MDFDITFISCSCSNEFCVSQQNLYIALEIIIKHSFSGDFLPIVGIANQFLSTRYFSIELFAFEKLLWPSTVQLIIHQTTKNAYSNSPRKSALSSFKQIIGFPSKLSILPDWKNLTWSQKPNLTTFIVKIQFIYQIFLYFLMTFDLC